MNTEDIEAIQSALTQATQAVREATATIGEHGYDWPALEPTYRGAGELVDAVRELVTTGVDEIVQTVMDPSLVVDDRDTVPVEDGYEHPSATAVADAPRTAKSNLLRATRELTAAADELSHLSPLDPED